MSTSSNHYSATTIQNWLITRLAELLALDPTMIDRHATFHSFGLSSQETVALSGELEDWLACSLPPTLLWDYPTIATLAAQFAFQPDVVQPHRSDEGGNEQHVYQREPIAIIGIGCRFPGADGPEAFWRLLCAGQEAIKDVPRERWDNTAFYDPDPALPGKTNTYRAGLLEQVETFDARFFDIAPREATAMDPQQRLLLEVAWEALEDAEQDVLQLAGSETGVFIGIATNDYSRIHLSELSVIDAYAGTGSAFSIAANRLSHTFDWHGPSIAIDTACSSSLVAVHLACQSLWNQETELALAGGVNMLLDPTNTIALSKAGVLAPDGRCKTFDASANGYVRGEGAGIVVLKPLSQALRDHDPLYAIIRGSAVNQDGHSNGLMAPNRQAQERVLQRAYKQAGVAPSQINYIEAHGTGTLLGDPIEVQALANVLTPGRTPEQPCRIGSVKTNIGHLEAAAGIAGLIKVALALKHGLLPPSLHFHEPNPHIPFACLPVQVQTTLTPWPISTPKLAGVSSFGFGGTNAHVVVEEAPPSPPFPSPPHEPQYHLLPLSARSPQALLALARRYDTFLASQDPTSWPAICASASRRTRHEHHLALLGRSPAEARERLQELLQEHSCSSLSRAHTQAKHDHKLVFVFSGHGSQWPGMGQQLLQQEPIFRHVIDDCDRIMQRYLSWSLLAELSASPEPTYLHRADVVQPLLFAISLGLSALWNSWGITPAAVVGQSMGEIAAAHVAGILNLEDSCRIICERSILLRKVSGQGSMLSVALPVEQAQQLINDYQTPVCIAAINSPYTTVLSGTRSNLEQLQHSLERHHIPSRWVNTDIAFHSPHMESLQYELCARLTDLQPHQSSIPFYSTVTGERCAGLTCTAEHWGRNLREPVRLVQALETLIQDGHTLFLEVSPHPILLSAIEQTLQAQGVQGHVFGSLRRSQEERATLLTTLGTLYTHGLTVNWRNLFPHPLPHISLPTYPWQRERYWTPARSKRQEAQLLQPNTTQTRVQPIESSNDQTKETCTYHEQVTDLTSLPPSRVWIESYLCEQANQLLHLPHVPIDLDTPLMSLGLDSLAALEFKNRLQAGLKLPLPATLVWSYPTIRELTTYIYQKIGEAENTHQE